MVNTGELESFLNEKSCSEGDVVEILEEGVIEVKEDSASGRKYTVLNLPVLINGREIIYTPNRDAIEVLQKAYGIETKKWKGKKFKVSFYPKTAFGQTKTAILPKIINL
jgi:hypothetical protein